MASEGSGLRYKDKVALVTGGSKGIGEGVVRVFGKHCHFKIDLFL